ncbi:MAG: hypothetical protein KME46_29650 [Brasilonema angustatum HA4187-MV1]|jgi:hypothetical protein|nr:hypothetical protein [Brasilonema angustatum HA4187-MV1]
MRKILGSRKVFEHATITFGIIEPTCDLDERGNFAQKKTTITLVAQIDRSGTSTGKQGDTEAYATSERLMSGHLVQPTKMPSGLVPGIIGRIEFPDGEINNCRLLPSSQISWKIIKCDRINLSVGAGAIARQT